jgi:hypothetical protein
VVVLYNTEESSANTPDDHDEGDPKCGTSTLHHHVTRDFCEYVEGEEDSQSNLIIVSISYNRVSGYHSTHVVVQTLHVKGLLKPGKTGISNVCAVEERQEVQQGEEGQQSQVDLSY